jgi:NAD(P)-dependent dehydrogenase (short-subunit alcohol dehydrogenase family)
MAIALDCCAVNDKQILITGATNGIGLAAAEALAAPRRESRHRRPQQEQDAGCLGPHQGGGQERSDGGHIRL